MTRPDTTRLVMKFGGTSMGDLERIRRAARIVAAEAATGKKVAVVVSAMAGKTNELVAWTDGAGPAGAGLPLSDDEYDVVVASGEQVTSGLLAMTLRNMGLNARSWMGWQVPIVTDDAHGRARIVDIPGETLGAAVDGGLQPGGHLADAGQRQDSGRDRGAAGRLFHQATDLQLAVLGQLQRAGNGGGRHGQQVNGAQARVAFGLKPLALVDAETVLFVDDRHGQPGEADGVLEQGVGADGDLGLT